MDSVLDFVINNYVWFIVAFIVIVMALIGYIADKTDFGRKEKQPKQEKKKAEKIKVQNKGIGDLTQDLVNNMQEESKEEPNLDEVVSNELDENVPSLESQDINEDLFAPLEGVNIAVDNTNEETNAIEETDNTPLEPVVIDSQEESNDTSVLEEDDVWKF